MAYLDPYVKSYQVKYHERVTIVELEKERQSVLDRATMSSKVSQYLPCLKVCFVSNPKS